MHPQRSTLEVVPWLVRPGPPTLPWYAAPKLRAMSTPIEPPSATERDSTLGDLHDAVPDLVARRVPTPSERDAAAKAALLTMHNTGRTLLVPPDNSGGLITVRIPVPLLSSSTSRARRARDTRAFDEGRARVARLRSRADSLTRARADSAAASH